MFVLAVYSFLVLFVYLLLIPLRFTLTHQMITFYYLHSDAVSIVKNIVQSHYPLNELLYVCKCVFMCVYVNVLFIYIFFPSNANVAVLVVCN